MFQRPPKGLRPVAAALSPTSPLGSISSPPSGSPSNNGNIAAWVARSADQIEREKEKGRIGWRALKGHVFVGTDMSVEEKQSKAIELARQV